MDLKPAATEDVAEAMNAILADVFGLPLAHERAPASMPPARRWIDETGRRTCSYSRRAARVVPPGIESRRTMRALEMGGYLEHRRIQATAAGGRTATLGEYRAS